MMLATLQTAFEGLARWMAYLAAGLILAMSLWITYDVLSRYFFDAASPWAFDLSEYALVWITFLAAPWVLLQDRHVRIDILVDVLPPRAQRAMGALVSAVAIFICGVLAWRTGTAAIEYYQNDIMMARIWRIPRIWPYVVVPLGSGLLALAFAVRLGLYLTRPDPEAELHARASQGQGTDGAADGRADESGTA